MARGGGFDECASEALAPTLLRFGLSSRSCALGPGREQRPTCAGPESAERPLTGPVFIFLLLPQQLEDLAFSRGPLLPAPAAPLPLHLRVQGLQVVDFSGQLGHLTDPWPYGFPLRVLHDLLCSLDLGDQIGGVLLPRLALVAVDVADRHRLAIQLEGDALAQQDLGLLQQVSVSWVEAVVNPKLIDVIRRQPHSLRRLAPGSHRPLGGRSI